MSEPQVVRPLMADELGCSHAKPAGLSGRYQPPQLDSSTNFGAWSIGFGDTEGAGWLHAGDLSIGCHGEIYNLPALGRELGLPPNTPALPVLAAAWRQWALDLLPKLDGCFVLIIRAGDELLLYRDPSGLRNLYFSPEPGNQVTFATHLAALPHSASMRRAMAPHSIQEYLRQLEVAPPHTLLAGVVAVEAGQSVHWVAAHASPRVAFPATAAPQPPADFSTAVDEVERLLRDAVRERLADGTRPAAFLSGGIDSALLCALALAERPDLTVITVGFDDAAFDEAPVARRIANHLGATHEVWRFTRAQYLGAFNRLSRQAEQPMADPAAMATLLAFERCRQRFDVVLDGTGADESVGLMPPRHVRLAVEHASRLPRPLRLPLARLLEGTPGLAGYAPVLDFDHPADTMSRWHGFRQREILQLTGHPVSLEHTQLRRTFERFGRHAHFERYSALLEALTCDRLNQAMAISDATVRFPFWDRDADRFIRQLRTEFRYLPGQPKRILRALLARFVPSEIWKLPKHSFNFPLREFLAGDDHALVRHHLDAAAWHKCGQLRAQEVQRYARRFIAGDANLTFRVWALVVLGAWLEQHPEALDPCA